MKHYDINYMNQMKKVKILLQKDEKLIKKQKNDIFNLKVITIL